LGEAGRMRRVLFVCTGNIFRSLTAEHGLRHALKARADIHVSSAGTVDFPHVVRPNVRDHLLAKGFDVSLQRSAALFLEACGETGETLPDIEEAVLDYQTHPAAVDAHGRATIERILSLTPRLASRLDALLHPASISTK
jgi:low molecular weight phosphotyrosine protein phosphatase